MGNNVTAKLNYSGKRRVFIEEIKADRYSRWRWAKSRQAFVYWILIVHTAFVRFLFFIDIALDFKPS